MEVISSVDQGIEIGGCPKVGVLQGAVAKVDFTKSHIGTAKPRLGRIVKGEFKEVY